MAKQGRKEKIKTTPTRVTAKKIDRRTGSQSRKNVSINVPEETQEQRTTRHEIQGILFGAIGRFLLVSLLSHHYYAVNPMSSLKPPALPSTGRLRP